MAYPPPTHGPGTVNGQFPTILHVLPFSAHPAPQTARSIRRVLSWSTVCPCVCFFFLSFSGRTLAITLPIVWLTCAVSLVFTLVLFFLLRRRNANPDYIKTDGEAPLSSKWPAFVIGLGVAGLWAAALGLIIVELKNVAAMESSWTLETGWRSRRYSQRQVLAMCILSLLVELVAFLLQLFLCYRFFQERRSFRKTTGAGGLVTQVS